MLSIASAVKERPESLRVKVFPKQMSDVRNLETVERLIPCFGFNGRVFQHNPPKAVDRQICRSQA